jgi:hypothetical protein
MSTADYTVPPPTSQGTIAESEQEIKYCPKISQWHFLPRPIHHALREVMLHIDDSLLRSLCPTSSSTRLPWLTAAIGLAPNIEVLHIHHILSAIPVPPFVPISTLPPPISTNLIPFLTEICAPSILPNLLLVVVHIDRDSCSDRGVGALLEKVAGLKFLEWTRGYPWSLVECEMGGEVGDGQQKRGQSCEHAFKVTDGRRLGGPSTRNFGSKDGTCRKAKDGKDGKEKFRRLSVDKGVNATGRVIEVVQGVKELELEAMDTRFEADPCSDQSMTHPMLVHG